MNEETIIKGLALLKSAYPNSLNNQTSVEAKIMIQTWLNFFKEEKTSDFEKAIKNIVSKEEFFPSIARVKKEIDLLTQPRLSVNIDDEWEKVIELIRGGKTDISLLNSISQKIIRGFNINRLFEMTTEELKWKKKEFIELFKSYQENPTKEILQIENNEKTLSLAELIELNEKQKLLEE